jgi:hypothetical protein
VALIFGPATNVGVHVITVEEERSDHELYEDWKGDVQLKWKHSHFYPQPGYVGKPVEYDLVSVNAEHFVSLHPIAAASSFNRVRTEKFRCRVWVQARATEANSTAIRVEISWDGVWAEATDEMAKHFIVKIVDA